MANSFVRYTGDNSTTSYSIPFSYRSTADLTVTLAGSVTTAFSLNSAGTTLTFTSAPAQDAAIEIRRRTSQTTKLVDYASGSVLTENDLDTDSDQAFFMSQESIDDANDVIKISNVDFQYDATNKQIRNVADPTSAQDVATKNYLENTWLSPANKTALTTVNANIANINAVNSNEANINSVNSNETNINTVATNIGSVNTVATDITKVIAVANDLAEAVSEVETVADDLNEATSEIDTVASSISNVDTVGTNIANVNTVAGISANVTTVAGNNANVSTVAGISGNVTTVAGISSDVTSVANDATDIGTVATDIANVNTVAGISGNVSTVAGISSNVTSIANNSANINSVAGNSTNINTVAGNNSNISTVAGISSNVTSVAGISSDVTVVAGDATDIGTVATDLAGSDNIGTVAGSIANVNNVGGSITNVNEVAGNLSGVNYFGERYRVSSSAPSTSLDVGDLYYDTTLDTMRVYGSSGWQNAGSSVNGTSERFNYTATGGQTTFTGSDNNGNTLAYDAGFIDVYLNGSKLLNGTDVTVTSGTSVVLASGATAGDVIDIVTYGTFSVATLNASNLTSGTVPSARISGAYTGITQTGTLTSFASTGIDDNATSTAITINSSESVGIGETSPLGKLHVKTADSGASANSNGDDLIVENSSNTGISILSGNSDFGLLLFGDDGDDNIGRIQYQHSDNSMHFFTNASEAMRIDSSGNLLVGKTTTALGTAGTSIESSGRINVTRDGGNSAQFTRLNSDGNILNFYKDGTSVGTIGTDQDDLVIGNGDVGFRFYDSVGQPSILPRTSSGGSSDNNLDLGSSASRWENLYLGGGLYVGGTGSANKLDDYEEGTFTPSIQAGGTHYSSITHTVQQGRYTKIGRQVFAHFRITTSAVTIGSASGNIEIENLPFTCSSADSTNQAGTIAYASGINFGLSSFDCVNVSIATRQNENRATFSKSRLNGTADGCHNSSIGQAVDVVGTAIYFVD